MAVSTAPSISDSPVLHGSPPFGPEMQLLCLCARSELAPATRARLREMVARPLDWDRVRGMAALHGVSGMLYHHLAQHASPYVPPDVLLALQQRAQSIQLYNLQVMTELLHLAALFQAQGIPLLTYKGPLLAERYYGSLAFRRFGDVDVLVNRDDLDAAIDLLRADGYSTVRGLSEGEEETWHDAQLGYELLNEEENILLEVHWALLNRALTFRLSPEEVWARAETVPIGPASIQVLAPDDLLLYLCAHGTKHHWSRLLWVSDVAQVLHRHPPRDWDAVVRRAQSIGSLRTLFLGVSLAARWLGSPLPGPLQARIDADARIDELVGEVETRWFGTEEGLCRPAGWATFWFAFRTRQRLRDNLGLLGHYARLAVTPTEQDYSFLALPSWLRGLYYLVRPLRLLRDGGSALFRS